MSREIEIGRLDWPEDGHTALGVRVESESPGRYQGARPGCECRTRIGERQMPQTALPRVESFVQYGAPQPRRSLVFLLRSQHPLSQSALLRISRRSSPHFIPFRPPASPLSFAPPAAAVQPEGFAAAAAAAGAQVLPTMRFAWRRPRWTVWGRVVDGGGQLASAPPANGPHMQIDKCASLHGRSAAGAAARRRRHSR